MENDSDNADNHSSGVGEDSPLPALAVRHCGDTYKACCLGYPTNTFPNGWCNCNCGDCRVAKYAALTEEAKAK